jgi:hypothetical protein
LGLKIFFCFFVAFLQIFPTIFCWGDITFVAPSLDLFETGLVQCTAAIQLLDLSGNHTMVFNQVVGHYITVHQSNVGTPIRTSDLQFRRHAHFQLSYAAFLGHLAIQLLLPFSGCGPHFKEWTKPKEVSSVHCRWYQTPGPRVVNLSLPNQRSHQGENSASFSAGTHLDWHKPLKALVIGFTYWKFDRALFYSEKFKACCTRGGFS